MKKLKQKLKAFFGTYRRANAAIICAVIAAVMLLNAAVTALVQGFSLYLYATPKYSHEIGQGTLSFLEEVKGEHDHARILFCMQEEELENDAVYNLVYQTAKQLEEAFSFISVETVNIYTNPEAVEPFKYRTVDGERVKAHSISKLSVIVEGSADFSVQTLSSFFVLDGDGVIESYNGEEIFAALIRYTLTSTHKIAYYTTSHGEKASSSLFNLLTCAGYTPTPIDLMTETPTDTSGVLVISNPAYDFISGAEGVEAEIEKLEAYMAAGGLVIACLDPLSPGLTNLNALFADMGLSRKDAIVKDSDKSITTDGYSLVLSFGDGDTAKAIKDKATAYNRARVITREASVIETSGAAVPLLLSSGSSKAYTAGEVTSSEGHYAVAALSQNEAGGGAFLSSGYYIAASDVLETDDYGNEEFFYALLSYARGDKVPLGATMVAIDNAMLQDLTVRQSRLWALLLVIVTPCAAALVGLVTVRRRRLR